MNKDQERFYVEQAAERLKFSWEILEDREIPDFLISEKGCTFGLEVSEIFRGVGGKKRIRR